MYSGFTLPLGGLLEWALDWSSEWAAERAAGMESAPKVVAPMEWMKCLRFTQAR
jgi:hypothetical protein